MGAAMGACMPKADADRFLNEDELMEKRARQARPIVVPARRMRTFEPDERVEGQGWRTMNVLANGLMLDIKVINQLYSLFGIADLDGSKAIDVYEFLYFLRLQDNPFNKRLFMLFDMDGSQEIDFLEFTCAIWNLCTWPDDELPELMFYLYDQDNSGYLELEECETLIADVLANRTDQRERELLSESLRLINVPGMYRGEKRVYREAFLEWARSHKEATHPLKCVHIMVRKRIIGSDYWEKVGVLARVRIMDSLRDIIRTSLGPPGARDAVARALVAAEKEREILMQRRQHDAQWEDSEDSIDADGARKVGHRKSLDETKHRVRAVQLLHDERCKRFSEWYKIMHRIETRGDPLSVVLRFSDRNFLHSLRREFEGEWREAMVALQESTYDRDGRLRSLLQDQKSKADLYFRRKTPQQIDPEAKVDEDARFSSATAKQTWAEQKVALRRRRRKELRLAGGNKHLARRRVGSDGEEYSGGSGSGDSGSGSGDSSSSSYEDSSDEESEEAFRARLAAEAEDRRLERQVPERNKRGPHRGQYKLQNVKRPPPGWREKRYKRLRIELLGELDSPGAKPYSAPKPGRRRNMRVYALD